MPTGYAVQVELAGSVVAVRLTSRDGETVGSGYAGETPDAFVYDRIVVASGHRQRGLGRALVAALSRAKTAKATPELLVATWDGRAF